MKKVRKLTENLWLSGLPRAKDIIEHRPATVIDVTCRPRPTVKRACLRIGAEYYKAPVTNIYDYIGIEKATQIAESAKTPVWIHCFRGQDRAPLVCQRVLRSTVGSVVLHGVGRNLARAYRLCSSFSIKKLLLHECKEIIKGNLYRATNTVTIETIDHLPEPSSSVLWLDRQGKKNISMVDWLSVYTIVIGGETCGLPIKHKHRQDAVRIHQNDDRTELTVESALAIALFLWGEARFKE